MTLAGNFVSIENLSQIQVFFSVKSDGDPCLWIPKVNIHQWGYETTEHDATMFAYWPNYLTMQGREWGVFFREVEWRAQPRRRHAVMQNRSEEDSNYLIELQGLGQKMVSMAITPTKMVMLMNHDLFMFFPRNAKPRSGPFVALPTEKASAGNEDRRLKAYSMFRDEGKSHEEAKALADRVVDIE